MRCHVRSDTILLEKPIPSQIPCPGCSAAVQQRKRPQQIHNSTRLGSTIEEGTTPPACSCEESSLALEVRLTALDKGLEAFPRILALQDRCEIWSQAAYRFL